MLTVAAFTNAYRAMRKGDHNQVQRMFRARIIAQGFTVAAMVVGGVYFGAERHKERELWKVQQAQKDEEKRMRWIHELEARDAEDKALQERLTRRRQARAAKKADEASDTASEASTASGSSWSSWVGVGGGGKKGEEAAPADTNEKGTSTLNTLGELFSKNAAVKKADDEKK